MPRYAAFLRGVMPTNCRMADLKRAFDAAGFANVVTVIGSGNVVFDARAASAAALEKKAEVAMQKALGKTFLPFIRPIGELEALLGSDPYRGTRTDASAKRYVTFLRNAPARLELPIAQGDATIARLKDGMVFSACLPTASGPEFMALLVKTLGKEQTTRTWQTIQKVVKA